MAEKEMDQEMNAAKEEQNAAENLQDKENQPVEGDDKVEVEVTDKENTEASKEEQKAAPKKKSRSRKSKTDKVAEENEELRIKLAEAQDKYLRLFSEFDNFRKRSNKEKVEILSSASGALIKELLPVMDDMDRAQDNFDKTEDMKALTEGVELIFNKFRKTLEAKGLKAMESTGEEFDTDIHEAIAQFPAPDESQKNKIIDTTEKGYTINDKVIRHAKVVVGV